MRSQLPDCTTSEVARHLTSFRAVQGPCLEPTAHSFLCRLIFLRCSVDRRKDGGGERQVCLAISSVKFPVPPLFIRPEPLC